MTLEDLKTLLDSGKFHHATYRYEYARGLHIYAKAEGANSFRGFEYVGCFSESLTPKATLDEARKLVAPTGVSVGSYGRG